jgi:hypothetical protein
MKVYFLPEAEEVLFQIALWIESKNTQGSGERFLEKFITETSSFALPNVKYAICRNKLLASFSLRCITIDNWVVAFKQTKTEFVVHYILNGSSLK